MEGYAFAKDGLIERALAIASEATHGPAANPQSAIVPGDAVGDCLAHVVSAQPCTMNRSRKCARRRQQTDAAASDADVEFKADGLLMFLERAARTVASAERVGDSGQSETEVELRAKVSEVEFNAALARLFGAYGTRCKRPLAPVEYTSVVFTASDCNGLRVNMHKTAQLDQSSCERKKRLFFSRGLVGPRVRGNVSTETALDPASNERASNERAAAIARAAVLLNSGPLQLSDRGNDHRRRGDSDDVCWPVQIACSANLRTTLRTGPATRSGNAQDVVHALSDLWQQHPACVWWFKVDSEGTKACFANMPLSNTPERIHIPFAAVLMDADSQREDEAIVRVITRYEFVFEEIRTKVHLSAVRTGEARTWEIETEVDLRKTPRVKAKRMSLLSLKAKELERLWEDVLLPKLPEVADRT